MDDFQLKKLLRIERLAEMACTVIGIMIVAGAAYLIYQGLTPRIGQTIAGAVGVVAFLGGAAYCRKVIEE